MMITGMQSLSLCDYPGTVSAVFFTQGCNFNCPFCHNQALIPVKPQSQDSVFDWDTVSGFLQARQRQLQGLVITGGEPTLQKGLADFLFECKQKGYRIKLDTNGSRPGVLKDILKEHLVDFIAMDIKAPWKKYQLLAGTKVETDSIKESMELIANNGISHQFRTTWYQRLLTVHDIDGIKMQVPQLSQHIVQQCKNFPNSVSTLSLGKIYKD